MSGQVVILGGPRSGKTTLSEELGIENVYHTDDLISKYGWTEASDIVAGWMNVPGPWIVEGTIAVRGLRKFLALHEGIKPCDKVIFRSESYVKLTSQQQNMADGIETIFSEIVQNLIDLDVEVRVDMGYVVQ